jgi:imidazoleglycerol phosphate dehydratase HisB
MKLEQAREILQNYINNRIIRHGNFVLPVDDVIVKSYTDIESKSFIEYTWKYLIQIAYNLD